MIRTEFEASLATGSPPADSNNLLRALWYDANDDWDRAHRIIQDLNSPEAARIHAYLHRKEGDSGNAGYWYYRAGVNPFTGTLAAEWSELVAAFCE